MKYLAKIGLEMHCEVSETKTKAFSSAKNEYTDIPNANVRPVDMAFPGTLPTINKETVKMALMASMILNCKQPEYMYFERKNYYYPDLPKGFQITQETKPIPVGIYGKVVFECNGEEKTVRVNNIHLEEDSASLDHLYNTSNIDYNRAGVPLLELVTEPDIHSADEAVAFIEYMKTIYQYAGISEADPKKGHIRCDVNISIMEEGLDEEDSKNWGTKIEIKNVNSLMGVRNCINYEIERQIELKENGKYDEMEQQTRRWDEESQTTIYMRSKVDAIDYKYFVEPNIPKFKITQKLLDEVRARIPELAHERKKKYMEEFGFSERVTNVLVKDKKVSDYFEKCIKLGCDPKSACDWIANRLLAEINKNEFGIDDIYIRPEMIVELVSLVENKRISTDQARKVFFLMLEENLTPKELVEKYDMGIMEDDGLINKLVDEVMMENPQVIEDYHKGRTNMLNYLVGQVMKKSKGKANPTDAKNKVLEKLEA